MGKLVYNLIAVVIILSCSKLAFSKEVSLSSKDFQKEFIQSVGNVMRQTAKDYLNNFLKDIKKPAFVAENFDNELKSAIESQRLEPKIVFIKQYLDMAEHKDSSRANMYGLRNVIFLKKLKDKFYALQEESFEEIHQLRYFYLCKQFKVQKQAATTPAYHNYYSRQSIMAPLQEEHMANMLNKLGLKDNHTVTVNVGKFGEDLYEKVKSSGAEVIDDYLVMIRKLLIEVLEPESEEETVTHSEAMRKFLVEIDALLSIQDFYKKRQRLYDYLQNHLAFDYEQIQNSSVSQQDLMEISAKLQAKGLDLVVAYLFSNFEFIDHLHDHWQQQLPLVPLSLYDAQSRPLKHIQQLYDDFKQDFENSTKYDAYLDAVKELHEKTREENADSTHIYEMLYSAAQNVGSSRATLMNAKCNELFSE